MSWGRLARNMWRRCQGGGEAPPQYQTPREEERVPNVVGPFGPEYVAAVPGRRRGTAAVSDTQGGGEGAQCRGAFRPGVKMRRCQGGGWHRR